ncbi:Reverse transcriptase, RNA-dependent DNA polymerase [Corchorus capsularis]|uniref:Reverse transcriptase, RNA-dependent DNA polymerase n=1 Tax=Corchorus capsularis TaxID=210143 RepID=A0A1R3I9P2_COCAP|nr:Reverse transcriptase, RNA-dependent DNA polymerase [Corchorus capsularis]
MVISWIFNALHPTLLDSIAYCVAAQEMWNDLEERFSHGNTAHPLSSLSRAYALVPQEERQQLVAASRLPSVERAAFMTNSANKSNPNRKPASSRDVSKLFCEHYKMTQHKKDSCFELLGYPEWWDKGKKQPKTKAVNTAQHVETTSGNNNVPINGLTSEQYAQLISMLNLDKIQIPTANFVAMVAKQFGKAVKQIRSDNAPHTTTMMTHTPEILDSNQTTNIDTPPTIPQENRPPVKRNCHPIIVTFMSIYQEIVSLLQPLPTMLPQVIKDTHWQEAMKKELEVLEQNHIWTLEQLPTGKRAIGSKWVYKIKYHLDGTVERYKARLVAKGYTQVEGLDYTELLHRLQNLPRSWSSKYFLGLEVARSPEGIVSSQRKYTLDILQEAGMLGTKHVLFPMEHNHKLAIDDSALLDDPGPEIPMISKSSAIVGVALATVQLTLKRKSVPLRPVKSCKFFCQMRYPSEALTA